MELPVFFRAQLETVESLQRQTKFNQAELPFLDSHPSQKIISN